MTLQKNNLLCTTVPSGLSGNPKSWQLKINNKPNLILIKGIKNAKSFLEIERPLVIYNEDNTYTDEILKIYNKK